MAIVLKSVAGKCIAEVDAATVGDLLDAAREQGYSRCSLIHKGCRLSQDPLAPLCDASVPPGAVVTLVGAHKCRAAQTAPSPAPPIKKPRQDRSFSMWGPAGPPTLGALHGVGPAAPPGSRQVGGKTVLGSEAVCEERRQREIRQGFESALVGAVQGRLSGCPEDAAREALRLSGGDPKGAVQVIAMGKLPVPAAVGLLLVRDLRESQLLAARALVQRDAGALARLMVELEGSHPQLYETAVATEGGSKELVDALSSDDPLTPSVPNLVGPDGTPLAIDASTEVLQEHIHMILKAFADKDVRKQEAIAGWLAKMGKLAKKDEENDPNEPETPH